jgi:hypothetical protein
LGDREQIVKPTLNIVGFFIQLDVQKSINIPDDCHAGVLRKKDEAGGERVNPG